MDLLIPCNQERGQGFSHGAYHAIVVGVIPDGAVVSDPGDGEADVERRHGRVPGRAIEGHQWTVEGHQRPSRAIQGHPEPSDAPS